MGKAYYADRISPHIARTPEGFLILIDQPICRSGWQPYHASEIDRSSGDNSLVQVYRSPSEVLAPAHIASLEGKLVASPHPSTFINSDTASWAAKGHIQNVRVGPKDSEGNVTLIADIHIHDPSLIDQILAKHLRSISLGYTYDLAEGPREGTFSQRNLIGNHCAIVQSGRAGPSTYIADASPEKDGDEVNEKTMDRLIELCEQLLKMRSESEDDDPEAEYERAAHTKEEPAGVARVIPISSEGGEGNVNPVAARDALTNLRRVRGVIEANGDREAIDAYNNAVRALKAQAALGERFNPRTSAYDSHSSKQQAAATFEKNASRFHRKPLKVHGGMPADEHKASDSDQPVESFEDAVRRARSVTGEMDAEETELSVELR